MVILSLRVTEWSPARRVDQRGTGVLQRNPAALAPLSLRRLPAMRDGVAQLDRRVTVRVLEERLAPRGDLGDENVQGMTAQRFHDQQRVRELLEQAGVHRDDPLRRLFSLTYEPASFLVH